MAADNHMGRSYAVIVLNLDLFCTIINIIHKIIKGVTTWQILKKVY